MIGLVVVSHSAQLAEGVCELAGQVGQGAVRLAAAGGTDDPEQPIGTDAFRVLRAIESVWSEDGVLVFMDLGSAVLSAETAFGMLEDERRARVHLCEGPVVELAVAAASQAGAGAGVEEILAGRRPEQAGGGEAHEAVVRLPNRLGLHARPAAQLVRLVRRFQARVTVENLTRGGGAADAAAIHGVLALGARQGDEMRVHAEGAEARAAVEAVREFLASGCGERDAAPAPERGAAAGLAASPGVAMGPLARYRPAAVEVVERTVDDPEAEARRLEAAIREAREETRALFTWAEAHAGHEEAGIFDAQELFLEDKELADAALRTIRERRANAEFAWREACGEFAARLAALEDDYLAARAADVADVAERVLRRLAGGQGGRAALREPSIVAARDLTPSEVRSLDPEMVLGLCLEGSSAGAHSVILARAMGIPAVVGLGGALAAVPEGTLVALDGGRGVTWIAPDREERREIERRRAAWLEARRAALAVRHRPARTRDGVNIRVLANISGVAEAAEALEAGAEGIGVLRTEFLFLGRATAPPEEEQLAAYSAIAEVMGARPLVVRTLDVGGDKSLPYIESGAEANPFLGWRGIRLLLGRRDLLRTQLRAILRAGAGHAVEILFPMISSVEEMKAARAEVAAAEAELVREGVPFQAGMKVGAMIEVPSAAVAADQLACHADFFSIGTNDLVQYAMAADRTNARVAALADPYQPAVLRLVRQAVRAAREAGIGVTLCGELAGDCAALPLLVGMGLREFSVSPPLVAELKQAIARTSAAGAEALAGEALELESSQTVRRLLAR